MASSGGKMLGTGAQHSETSMFSSESTVKRALNHQKSGVAKRKGEL